MLVYQRVPIDGRFIALRKTVGLRLRTYHPTVELHSSEHNQMLTLKIAYDWEG